MREGGDSWTPRRGHGGAGIQDGLLSADVLLDGRQAGDAIERLRLHSQPGSRDLLAAASTDAVRMGVEGGQRLLNPSKLFQSEQLDRQGYIEFMSGGGVVYRVGEQFRCGRELMGHRCFVREYRSKSMEFVLKFDVLCTLSSMNVGGFRRNNSRDTVRGIRGQHRCHLPMAQALQRPKHQKINGTSNLRNTYTYYGASTKGTRVT